MCNSHYPSANCCEVWMFMWILRCGVYELNDVDMLV